MPDTGLKRWMVVEPPMKLELIQRLPDQTRGFFTARNFTAEQADDIAVNGCVFQTIGTNTNAPAQGDPKPEDAFDIDLSQWRLHHGGGDRSLKLKSDWDKAWGDSVSMAARVAFRWATFPTDQTYYAGDYNWGMTTFALKPGEKFDLTVVWERQGKRDEVTIKGIECAPDTDRLSQ